MKQNFQRLLATLLLLLAAAPFLSAQITLGGWTVTWTPGMACIGSPTIFNATATGPTTITSPDFLWRIYDPACPFGAWSPCEYYTASASHDFTTTGVHTAGVVIRDLVTGDSINITFGVLVSSACAGTDFVSGNVYLDLNGNGVEDAGDVKSTFQHIGAAPLDTFGSGNLTGDYGFYLPGGSYTVGCLPPNPAWTVSEPAGGTYSVALPGGGGAAPGLNFGLAPVSAVNDLAVSSGISGAMSPGSIKLVGATVSNHGTTLMSGSLDVALDADLTYLSASPGAVYMSGGSPVIGAGTYSAGTHTVTFTFTDLPPFAYFHVTVSVLIPAATPMGTAIVNTATVNPLAGDATPADNVDTGPAITVGPYDPNDKMVTPAGSGPSGMVPPDTRLTYHVRFQNTGTWYANNVIIRDTLDADLDPASFEMRGASHAYGYALHGNVLEVGFYGIMLPDSGMDEPGSHGYFTFAISPKAGLPLGTEATNSAAIYFDFNPPIITNTTLTTFDSVTTVPAAVAQAGQVLVFPHPVGSTATISVPGLEGYLHFQLFSLNGQLVLDMPAVPASGFSFSRGGLASGMYTFQLTGQDGSSHKGKLILD